MVTIIHGNLVEKRGDSIRVLKPEIELSDYYTKREIDTMIAATGVDMDELLASINKTGVLTWKFTSDGVTTKYELSESTSMEANEFMVNTGRIDLIPHVDFTITDTILTLTADVPVGEIIHIRQLPQAMLTSSVNLNSQIASSLFLYQNHSAL